MMMGPEINKLIMKLLIENKALTNAGLGLGNLGLTTNQIAKKLNISPITALRKLNELKNLGYVNCNAGQMRKYVSYKNKIVEAPAMFIWDVTLKNDELLLLYKKIKEYEIDRYSKISSDRKSLIVRIPNDVANALKIKKGYYLRFFGNSKINIKIVKDKKNILIGEGYA